MKPVAIIFIVVLTSTACSCETHNDAHNLLTASFTFSPASPAAGQVVQFTDTSAGTPSSWLWNFGDGTSSTAQNPSHAYTTAGSKTVTLTVTNTSGSNNTSRTVTVATALTASFTFSPASPEINQTVQFTDTSAGTPASWQWNFNDGSPSTAQKPSHVFITAGSFGIGLTVSNSASSDSVIRILNINPASTDTHTAASPSLADVRSAINAASPGDTVRVPAGSATWTQELVIDKKINLIGAGQTSTYITSNYTAGDYLIYFWPPGSSTTTACRISGFNFNFANKCYGINVGSSPGYIFRNVRIDHNIFQNAAGNLVGIAGAVFGVADNNSFIHTQSGRQAHDNHQDSQWCWNNLAAEYGTENNFYYEDNTYTGPGIIVSAGGQGNRYCVRHNTITNTDTSVFWMFDMHGSYTEDMLSAMVVEVYGNTINSAYGVGSLDQRGSMALFYNNIFSCSTVDIGIRNEYNTNVDLLSPVTATNGEPKRIHKSYYWGNKNKGTRVSAAILETAYYSNLGRNVPQFNIDCFDEVASFNGSSGVGVGTLASRPASCSTEGVGYWATDQNRLYRWHNGAWEVFYTPYTYPHPLRTLLSDIAYK